MRCYDIISFEDVIRAKTMLALCTAHRSRELNLLYKVVQPRVFRY